MNGPAVETCTARPDEMPRVISCIVAAFIADPFARFVWPSLHEYLHSSPRFIREFAGGSLEHGSAYVSADFSGAALWLPPGVHADADAVERVLRETAQPEHLGDVLLTLERMDQSHPTEAHWYLPTIGVEPNAQRRGLGEALMRHALARCDNEGLPAYLESTNPRNISLYQRHGFTALCQIRVGAGPLITPMRREPR